MTLSSFGDGNPVATSLEKPDKSSGRIYIFGNTGVSVDSQQSAQTSTAGYTSMKRNKLQHILTCVKCCARETRHINKVIDQTTF